ncbi:hypothetical protein, partial [Micromonospora sp. NPDC005172]|uniref:hypothetical protein n=1 Tax=Micromonospora sp. NPDC005172 TaxID=3156867 RepID=UPI0033BDAB4E
DEAYATRAAADFRPEAFEFAVVLSGPAPPCSPILQILSALCPTGPLLSAPKVQDRGGGAAGAAFGVGGIGKVGPGVAASRVAAGLLEVAMRALLWVVGVVAGVLILLGLILEAVRWLIIIGLIALVIVIILGVVKGRQAMNHQGRRR